MADFIFGTVGLDAITALQSVANPLLNLFFVIVTNLGSEIFYVIIVVIIFAALDKKVGIRLALYLLITGLIVGMIKGFVSWMRPYQAHPDKVEAIASADGYSFPSGHAQSSGAFWTGSSLQARNLKREWTTVILGVSVLMIFLVGLSRVYLGVHYPGDVVVGWLIGIVVTILLYKYERQVMAVITARLSFKGQILGAIVLWLTTFFLYLAVMMFLHKDFVVGDISNIIGLLIGITVGYEVEEQYINYEPPKNLMHQAIAAIAAIMIALITYVLLALIFPKITDPLIYVILRAVRYFLLGFILILGIPLVLRRVIPQSGE